MVVKAKAASLAGRGSGVVVVCRFCLTKRREKKKTEEEENDDVRGKGMGRVQKGRDWG